MTVLRLYSVLIDFDLITRSRRMTCKDLYAVLYRDDDEPTNTVAQEYCLYRSLAPSRYRSWRSCCILTLGNSDTDLMKRIGDVQAAKREPPANTSEGDDDQSRRPIGSQEAGLSKAVTSSIEQVHHHHQPLRFRPCYLLVSSRLKLLIVRSICIEMEYRNISSSP
jgi:hypothetical protein